jgi:transposase-like protein
VGKGRTQFDHLAPRIVAAQKAGASLADACRENDISERTVKGWLTKGRKNPDSPYANFAFAIDFIREARDAPDSDEPVDDEEVQLHLSRAIRNGSVPAMKVWTDTYRKKGGGEGEEKKPADPLGKMDELAARRVGARA